MGSIKNSNLGQAWLVLLLSIVFSVSLTAVHLNLGPVIEENKTKETMKKIPVLVTGKDSSEYAGTFDISSRFINVDKNGITKSYTVYDAFDKDGTVAGHVVKATGQGYGDKIELLLGLDPDGKTITGLFILDQKETPGLGNKIVDDAWRNQYVGKSSDSPLVVVKGKSADENEIDAISGATISSRAVTDIVNSTIADVKPKIMIPASGNKMEKN
jgi:electron transport complex protein RnfG